MRFPKLSNSARYSLKINDLSGGLNLRDTVDGIRDNQLSDSLNMWHHNGLLESRPAMKAAFSKSPRLYEDVNAKTTAYDISREIDGEVYTLISIYKHESNGIDFSYISFEWISANSSIDGGSFTLPYTNKISFVIQHRKILYCFTQDYRIFENKYEEGTEWTDISSEIYAPLTWTHCKTSGDIGGFESGTQIDGFNLIGDKYKMIYSTVNRDVLNENFEESSHLMFYKFAKPISGAEYQGKEVIAKITKGVTTTVHRATITTDDGLGEEAEVNSDGLKMFINHYCILFKTADGWNASVKWNDFIEDNLEITVPYIQPIKKKDKVFKMSRTKWYGGSSEGINGGVRLFLCSNEAEPNLMIWSDTENPLYFSENAYAYVGKDASKIVNFGVADDSLYIFKPNHIYATRYTKGDVPSAKEVINQGADVSAEMVFFPLWTVHDSIGCDLPDTIQLCRNRLVWCHSDGNVYTLTNNSQNSERNVYTVGEMIKRDMNFKLTSSADWNGHYIVAGESEGKLKMFALNYNSNGYQYPYSFNKAEDSNIATEWYKWEFTQDRMLNPIVANIGNKFTILSYLKNEKSSDCVLGIFRNGDAEENINADLSITEKPFESMAQSKLYDFGASDIRKTVTKMNIGIGKNGNEPIKIDFLCESGKDETELTLYDEAQSNNSIGYTVNTALFPTIQSSLLFGFKIATQGKLSIKNLTIKYKLTGGAR